MDPIQTIKHVYSTEGANNNDEPMRMISFNTLNYGVTIQSNMVSDSLDYMIKSALDLLKDIKKVDGG